MSADATYVISQILGWASFAAWSISFWPQVILNYQRKSVVGLSFEFLAYNVTAFTFYSTYNIVKYVYSPSSVQINNIAFGLHAVLVTLITIIQCFLYKVERQRVHPAHTFICALLWCIAMYTLILGLSHVLPIYTDDDTAFSFVDLLGWIKVFITVVKYMPQAYLNYRRQSTVGWSIVSILFDMLFLMQHYILYTDRTDPDSGALGAFEPAGAFDVNKTVVNRTDQSPSRRADTMQSGLLDGVTSPSSSNYYVDPSSIRPPSYYSSFE